MSGYMRKRYIVTLLVGLAAILFGMARMLGKRYAAAALVLVAALLLGT